MCFPSGKIPGPMPVLSPFSLSQADALRLKRAKTAQGSQVAQAIPVLHRRLCNMEQWLQKRNPAAFTTNWLGLERATPTECHSSSAPHICAAVQHTPAALQCPDAAVQHLPTALQHTLGAAQYPPTLVQLCSTHPQLLSTNPQIRSCAMPRARSN
eukprot:scaffold62201_cov18-Tisochrysis_lutea.AAC.2